LEGGSQKRGGLLRGTGEGCQLGGTVDICGNVENSAMSSVWIGYIAPYLWKTL